MKPRFFGKIRVLQKNGDFFCFRGRFFFGRTPQTLILVKPTDETLLPPTEFTCWPVGLLSWATKIHPFGLTKIGVWGVRPKKIRPGQQKKSAFSQQSSNNCLLLILLLIINFVIIINSLLLIFCFYNYYFACFNYFCAVVLEDCFLCCCFAGFYCALTIIREHDTKIQKIKQNGHNCIIYNTVVGLIFAIDIIFRHY